MVHEQMVNGFCAAKLLQILRISKPPNMFYSIFSKQKNTTHCRSACCIFRFSFRNLSNMFPYIRPMPIFIFSSQIALFRHEIFVTQFSPQRYKKYLIHANLSAKILAVILTSAQKKWCAAFHKEAHL